MIEDVEYDIDELPDSYFSKAAVRIFNEIETEKACFLPSSKLVDFIETIEKGFHGEDLTGRLQKVDPH